MSRTTTVDGDAYARDGFVQVEVLGPAELARYREAMDALDALEGTDLATNDVFLERRQAETEEAAYRASVTRGEQAYRKDEIVQGCAMPELLKSPELSELIADPRILAVVEALIGPDLILDNAVILAADAGVRYQQGWHRDSVSIPARHAAEVEAMASPRWFHNCVQLNLAIASEDSAFWCIPGSHSRPNTPAERAVFGGDNPNPQSPINVDMPGGIQMRLPAGSILFHNNNLIHRGHCDPFPAKRRTFHAAFHSAARPPTWHFHTGSVGRRYESLSDAQRRALSPRVHAVFSRRRACAAQYPDVVASYTDGFQAR